MKQEFSDVKIKRKLTRNAGFSSRYKATKQVKYETTRKREFNNIIPPQNENLSEEALALENAY
jgi:hypothetical protein